VELWANHWLRVGEQERAKLRRAPLPVRVFNSYATPDAEGGAEALQESWLAATELAAQAMKFNVGSAPGDADRARHVLRMVPPELRLRCECHPGTWLETPEAAAEFFSTLETPRVEAILHPFALTSTELARWLRLLGPRITELHVQGRDETGAWMSVARRADHSAEVCRALEDHGFAGDVTLEFTAGTATPGEQPEALWASALEDLAFLRAHLPGGAHGSSNH
jgi:sugar phosphate isomerase/epimerase